MKHIADEAETAGQPVERILCAADPDSLDAVYLPDSHEAWADGTAPHIMEPQLPGVRDIYVDLSRFLDTDGLQAQRTAIAELLASLQEGQARARHYIQAAGKLFTLGLTQEGTDVLTRRARQLARHELPGRPRVKTERMHDSGTHTEQRKFLCALTPHGPMLLEDTITALCPRVITLSSRRGQAYRILAMLRKETLARGCAVISCPHPLSPEDILAQLLVPEAGVAFLADDGLLPAFKRPDRRLHLDRKLSPEPHAREREKALQTLIRLFCLQAADNLSMHNRLEQLYHPYMDFSHLSEWRHTIVSSST